MVSTVTLEIDKWTETDADVDPRPYAAYSVVLSRFSVVEQPLVNKEGRSITNEGL